MEGPSNKKPKLEEDPDANCRLRHGLNVHCLEHIFRYLNTRDLFTLGEMNEFYQQIINDFIIKDHNINGFDLNIPENMQALSEFFQKYGRKIRKFHNIQLSQSVVQLIVQYCSIDQLKSVEYLLTEFPYFPSNAIEHPNPLRDVQKFMCTGPLIPIMVYTVNMQFSENLRYLKLSHINLRRTFDWKQLINLTELHLDSVHGMNEPNFIEFLQQPSKLERFYNRCSVPNVSRQTIYETMSKYCNNHIQILHDELKSDIARNSYNFLWGLKSLREMGFLYNYYCSRYLKYAFKMLAENDTIEKLVIQLRSHALCNYGCVRRRRSAKIVMKPFTKLKTLRMYTNHEIDDSLGKRFPLNKHNKDPCSRVQLLIRYSAEILSKVETIEVIVESEFRNWEFLKYAPKLRQLYFVKGAYVADDDHLWAAIAFDIIADLKMILQPRTIFEHRDDLIELKVDEYFFVIFDRLINIGDYIKLIRMSEYEIERFRGADVNFRLVNPEHFRIN